MSVQTQTSENVPHGRYHETSRKAYNCQQNVADAWAAGAYPTHNVGERRGHTVAVLYTGRPRERMGRSPRGTSTNFHGVQRADGTGVLWHYSTREAIRTKTGLVISNSQCWATGFAHCSTPSNYDYRVPLEALEEFLDDEDDVFDIVDVRGQDDYRWVRNSVVVIDGESGRYGVFFGRDRSATRHGQSAYAFRLSGSELSYAEDVESIPDRFLMPEPVARRDMPVVTSDEYTKTRLSDDEQEAHAEAGGSLTEIETASWRDNYMGNRQHFRADLQDTVIVRQGEWFFIPMPEAGYNPSDFPDGHDRLGNHEPRRKDGAILVSDEECRECGSTAFESDGDDWACSDCGRPMFDVFVRGTVRHTGREHDMINLGDTWHLAVTHGRDVLTYRTGIPDGRTGGGGRRWD